MTGHGSGDHRRAGVSVRPRREAAGIVPLPPTSERRDMQARASQASRAPGLTPRPTAGPCQNRQFCAPHRQRSRHRTPAHTRQGDCYHTAGLAVTPRNSLRLETGRPGARSTSPAATSARAAAHRHIRRRWPGPSQRAQVFGEDCAGQGAGAVLARYRRRVRVSSHPAPAPPGGLDAGEMAGHLVPAGSVSAFSARDLSCSGHSDDEIDDRLAGRRAQLQDRAELSRADAGAADQGQQLHLLLQ